MTQGRNPNSLKNLRPGGPGRPKGVPNKASVEVKALCTQLVEDPAYLERFKTRLVAGKLPPAVEAMVWAYAYGRPVERMEVKGAALLPPLQLFLHPAGIEGDKQ